MNEVRRTGVMATEAERGELIKMVNEASRTPVITLRMGDPDLASRAWERVKVRCHKIALAHGLPEIPGYYGLGEDGEFVYVG